MFVKPYIVAILFTTCNQSCPIKTILVLKSFQQDLFYVGSFANAWILSKYSVCCYVDSGREQSSFCILAQRLLHNVEQLCARLRAGIVLSLSASKFFMGDPWLCSGMWMSWPSFMLRKARRPRVNTLCPSTFLFHLPVPLGLVLMWVCT